MARISRELKIGIYFIITIIALYWGINFLKGKDIFGNVNTFYAVYDNVEGLAVTSIVSIKGLKVGTVEAITFQEKTNKFSVKMRIQSKYNIPQNSVAHIYSSDILGNKSIKIEVGNDSIFLANKGLMASAIDTDLTTTLVNEIIPLKNKAEQLIDELNTTFKSVNKVLDSNTVTNIHNSIARLSGTLANVEKLTYSLSNDRNKISSILSNIDTITHTIGSNSNKISNTLNNFSSLSDSLSKIQIGTTIEKLNAIISQIEAGKGSLGKLINNDSLYNNFSNSLHNLDLLLKDLKEHPKRYVNLSIFSSN